MIEEHGQAVETAGQAHERATRLLSGLISAASADKVYSEPVVAGDRTIITAAEIRTGMGFGYGLAMEPEVPAERTTESAADVDAAVSSERHNGKVRSGPRAGGGGGGQAVARPVAVITMSPDGVTVEPVLDRTRIALTALTAFGAAVLMLIGMRHNGRR